MTELEDLVRRGSTIALSDGAGMPRSAFGRLSEAAARAGDVNLLLGWCLGSLEGLDLSAFASVRALVGGYGVRPAVEAGQARYVPMRLGAMPALMHHVRPDLLVASVGRTGDGVRFTTEVGWLRAAVDAGALVAAVERPGLPVSDAGPPLPEDRLVVVDRDPGPPTEVGWREPRDVDRAIGRRVASLVPEGARIQFGPGTIAQAVLEALDVPVVVDSGILSDTVVDLDRRGLLLPAPVATYLAGSAVLYDWAMGRPMLREIEFTHDVSRLATGTPFVAINTALEVDLEGQVNVEAIGHAAIASVGGHPDFSFAGSNARNGLSIVALRSLAGGRPTLVERLSAPVSTPSHDVDVLVTEHGTADLRGRDRQERRALIASLQERS